METMQSKGLPCFMPQASVNTHLEDMTKDGSVEDGCLLVHACTYAVLLS